VSRLKLDLENRAIKAPDTLVRVTTVRTSGRRRDEGVRSATLDAARTLVASTGYERLTIEAVALRSGSGRATLYRWWGSKADLVADAYLSDQATVADLRLTERSADLHEDVEQWFCRFSAWYATDEGARVMLALSAVASENEGIADRLNRAFTAPLRQSVTNRLSASFTASESATLAELLMGVPALRCLMRMPPLSRDEARAVVDVLLRRDRER